MSQPALNYFAIVGVGRSGTTLLMSMLNAHPDIVMPPEFFFISQHIARKPQATLLEAINKLKCDHRFERLKLTIDEVIIPFQKDVSFSMPQLYKEILRVYLQKHPALIIGDKAPKNIEYLPIVKTIFPEAKIIHIIRDPRDVYLSRKKAAWSSHHSDISHFLAYEVQFDLGRSTGRQLFEENYLEVYYERLLTNPEEQLRQICALLGVEFSKHMLNFSEAARKIVFEEEIAWKKEALGPLLTNNIEKWRKQLKPRQVLKIEAACPTVFRDGCYQYSQYHQFQGFIKLFFRYYIRLLAAVYKRYVLFRNRKIVNTLATQKLYTIGKIRDMRLKLRHLLTLYRKD